MATKVMLKPNSSLLDANFEGYKLALEPLALYTQQLTGEICQTVPNERQYSLQNAKIFAFRNHLSSDPWHDDYLYYICDRRIVYQVKFQGFGFQDPQTVLEIPASIQGIAEYDVSLHFTSAHQVIIADGRGTLHLIMSEDRSSSTEWKIVYSGNVSEENKPFVVVHSRVLPNLDIECLLLSCEECNENTEPNRTGFVTVLNWITLSADNSGKWSVKRKRTLSGMGPVEYAAINEESVIIANTHPFAFVYDSEQPIAERVEPSEKTTGGCQPILYAWKQSPENVTMAFNVKEGSVREDIAIEITSTTLSVKVKNGSFDLNGYFFAEVDPEDSTWTCQDGGVEIVLVKANRVVWTTLLIDDMRGEEFPDPIALNEIDRLVLQPAEPLPVVTDIKPAFDSSQLEDCDAYPSHLFKLSILDGESHRIIHQENLSGHQWLFTVTVDPESETPAFCIRHDVDGLVWQPNKTGFVHCFTLHAFGYVQASKQQRKFSTCSPDGAFVAISDVSHHVYIYHKPRPLATNLRNRRNERIVKSVARQQVVSLGTTDPVIGMQATKTNLYVLTKNSLFAIHVVHEDETIM